MEYQQSRYVQWLQRKNQPTPIFQGAGIYWQIYGGALIPATIKPLFIDPEDKEVIALLRQSGAAFVRFTSRPSETPTAWWYMVCEKYDGSKHSANTRYKVRRAHKNFVVKPVDPLWLAHHGYSCYLAAASRYSFNQPTSEDEFRRHTSSMQEGPFEPWGIFSQDELAGYGILIREDNDITTAVLKFHPRHLKGYCAYAFFDGILSHYVADLGLRINNGNRAISHDTHIQDFLLKFGYSRWYGHLKVAYQPWLAYLVRLAYPFRAIFDRLPFFFCQQKMNPTLRQEEFRRQCLNTY
jgi:hypothetical protein